MTCQTAIYSSAPSSALSPPPPPPSLPSLPSLPPFPPSPLVTNQRDRSFPPPPSFPLSSASFASGLQVGRQRCHKTRKPHPLEPYLEAGEDEEPGKVCAPVWSLELEAAAYDSRVVEIGAVRPRKSRVLGRGDWRDGRLCKGRTARGWRGRRTEGVGKGGEDGNNGRNQSQKIQRGCRSAAKWSQNKPLCSQSSDLGRAERERERERERECVCV